MLLQLNCPEWNRRNEARIVPSSAYVSPTPRVASDPLSEGGQRITNTDRDRTRDRRTEVIPSTASESEKRTPFVTHVLASLQPAQHPIPTAPQIWSVLLKWTTNMTIAIHKSWSCGPFRAFATTPPGGYRHSVSFLCIWAGSVVLGKWGTLNNAAAGNDRANI